MNKYSTKISIHQAIQTKMIHFFHKQTFLKNPSKFPFKLSLDQLYTYNILSLILKMSTDYLRAPQQRQENMPSSKNIHQLLEEQIKELKLKMSSNNNDRQQIFDLLNQYLGYPSLELAKTHRHANRLGINDLTENQQLGKSKLRAAKKICNCCGFIVQNKELSFSEDLTSINNLGMSTIFYFKTIINLLLLLLVMFVVYSIFSFVTNFTEGSGSGYLRISLAGKNNNENGNTLFLVQCWLGAAVMLIWFIMFIYFSKNRGYLRKNRKRIQRVSHYSVAIENIPFGFTKEDLQIQLDVYWERVLHEDKERVKKFKIQKYNQGTPFYFNQEEFKDQEFSQILKMSEELRGDFKKWISERIQFDEFASTHAYRNAKYKQYFDNEEHRKKKYEQIVQKITKKMHQKQNYTLTTAFVTFQSIEQRQLLLALNGNGIVGKVRRCFGDNNALIVEKDNRVYEDLEIYTAPQPEDIHWGNLGLSGCEKFGRRFLTIFLTIVMLGISFAIVYGLSTIQRENKGNRYVSLLISLTIAIINLIIIKVIQFTSLFERLVTMNLYQISIASKSIVAQVLNLIAVPFIVNFYIKGREALLGESGLVEDIFILGITSSFIPPLVKLIDPWARYLSIRYWYYKEPINRVGLNQYEFNALAQKQQFQLGLEYIYLISNFLFTCFYVSLHPILPAFAMLGYILIYWIQKYSLFYRSQRPVPGMDVLSNLMNQFIYFGGVAYVLGALTWSTFIVEQSVMTDFNQSLAANLVAAGFALLILFFPFDSVFGYHIYSDEHTRPKYEERRIYFSSQYDRLNPATAQAGVDDYRTFLLFKKKEISGMNYQEQKQIADNLFNLTQNNVHRVDNPFNLLANNAQENELRKIFNHQARNVISPNMLQSVILPQNLTYEQEDPNFRNAHTEMKIDQINLEEDTSKNLYPQFGGGGGSLKEQSKHPGENNHNLDNRYSFIKFDQDIPNKLVHSVLIPEQQYKKQQGKAKTHKKLQKRKDSEQ